MSKGNTNSFFAGRFWQQVVRWRRVWVAVSLLALFVPPVYNYVLTSPVEGVGSEDSYERISVSLQQDLGFLHTSPSIQLGARQEQVIALHPDEGGRMYRAGIQSGDILLDYRSIHDFYRMLAAARGKVVVLYVVEGGDGLSLEDRPLRIIHLEVPAMR